jgi:hypothetical protein
MDQRRDRRRGRQALVNHWQHAHGWPCTGGLTQQAPWARGIYPLRSASLPPYDPMLEDNGAKRGPGAAAEDSALAHVYFFGCKLLKPYEPFWPLVTT